jgi:hypothetical protein
MSVTFKPTLYHRVVYGDSVAMKPQRLMFAPLKPILSQRGEYGDSVVTRPRVTHTNSILQTGTARWSTAMAL